METIVDAVTLALALSVQIGTPVAVLFLIGYRSYRMDRPKRGNRGDLGSEGPRQAAETGSLRREAHCWELKGCPPNRRATCPARFHPELPCWQATKQALGRLQDRCLNCERFLAPPSR